jgi:hypothetical protein
MQRPNNRGAITPGRRFFCPFWGWPPFPEFTHGLRHGLYSFAPSELPCVRVSLAVDCIDCANPCARFCVAFPDLNFRRSFRDCL